MYAGEVLVSAVDENGDYQVDKLQVGDIWYFPKGSAHTVQGNFDFRSTSRSFHLIQLSGLAAENEYLLVFDDGM